MKPADTPLKVEVENDQLVIRIGINTLAIAAENCPEFYQENDPPYVTVSDPLELANDVVRELSREQEDGTTPVHLLLDRAILAAFENGSLGFDDESDE
jgi:hypothetical protein